MKRVKEKDDEFHAVEFMTSVRADLTKQFYEDRNKYLEYLSKAMEEFKIKQEKQFNQPAV
ncbi:MAG: hypothetical protein RIF33_11405 [Cyclobacteriaceae bacterium]